MWNPEYCGPGPSANLRLVIQPDPVGVDDRRLNKEYVAIVNDGVERVDLSGWVIRDGSLDWLRLPAGTGVDPAAVLTIRSGSGRNTASTVYWSRRSPVWANFTTAAGTRTRFGFIGDGAYLIDPVGNVRASKVYPCLGSCRIRPGQSGHLQSRLRPSRRRARQTEQRAHPYQEPRRHDLVPLRLRDPSRRFRVRVRAVRHAGPWRGSDHPAGSGPLHHCDTPSGLESRLLGQQRRPGAAAFVRRCATGLPGVGQEALPRWVLDSPDSGPPARSGSDSTSRRSLLDRKAHRPNPRTRSNGRP